MRQRIKDHLVYRNIQDTLVVIGMLFLMAPLFLTFGGLAGVYFLWLTK
jgi:hypothetical protein